MAGFSPVAVYVLGMCCLCVVQSTGLSRSSLSGTRRTPRYFDDYLISVTQPREHNQVLKDASSEDDGEEAPAARPEADILGYFRDVPREHWSCCMLGRLAGDKGFHCVANFYATRIARRNHNRAHNRRMLFNTGRNPVVNWGRDLMTTFGRCIDHHAQEFHDCCYTAAIETTERRKWLMYRRIEEEFPDS